MILRRVCLIIYLAFSPIVHSQKMKNLVPFVDPLIGTAKTGHTFPGATVPFGSVQISPDTDTISYDLNGKYNPTVYEYCAGYRYEDPTIVGFSATHYNGTGHSDLGDFLIMPTVGPLKLNPGTTQDPDSGYRSRFSHKEEKAEAGYYKVRLADYNILAELTATTRTAVERYTFPKSNDAHIILDMIHGIYNYPGKNIWSYVRVQDSQTITGYRRTNGWAKNRMVYFAIRFSKPFASFGQENYDPKSVYGGFWGKFNQNQNFPEIQGKDFRVYFNFKTTDQEPIEVRLAVSPVSQENALENLKTETDGFSFEQIKNNAQDLWNRELNKIILEGSDHEKRNFYTAMYHTFINPTIYMDVNGQYKGLDQNIHRANGFTHYTTFSLWDTFRALHPFFNIVQTKRNDDMVKSMLKHYDQFSMKMLPIWASYANENWTMSGYHSVSVIADAIIKGNYSGDPEAALDACVVTANHRDYMQLGDYIDLGYIPAEKTSISVSNALEYAYDDWAIAQLAKHLGKTDIYNTFIKRSENWKKNYNPATGFMQPRLENGSFKKDFDPLKTDGQGFIEGNSWNYSFFVPEDPTGLIKIMGGKKKFVAKLDQLFTMHLPDKFFAETEDITRDGLVGGYVHGNEPSHHVAYLYDFAGEPWKTQKWVRTILKAQYQDTPDGLHGNDDTGQMSAWYILSSLGFYPVAPGSEDYSIGSPSVTHAVINLENGKTFIVEAINQSPENVYIQKVLLNGKLLEGFTLRHSEIMAGGKLKFYMGPKPRKSIQKR